MIPAALAAIRGPLQAMLLDADLDGATLLGEGWGVIAYRVPDPAGDWAVRVTRGAAFAAVTGDLEREVRLLPLLEAAGFPTPRDARAIHKPPGIGALAGVTRAQARGTQADREREARPVAPELVAVAHRLIEGEPLTRARPGRGVRRAALAAALGAFFTRLHAFPRAEARAAGVPELDLWADRYESMLADGRAALGPRSRAWLDATITQFLAAGGIRGAPLALVHGDIAPGHILISAHPEALPSPVEGPIEGPAPLPRTSPPSPLPLRGEGGRISIIDFGDALIADPALDFGGLLLAYGWPFAEQVLAAYGGDVDVHFRRRMRFYVDVVPIFLVAFGHLFNDGQDRADGLRQFAARAAAATRGALSPRSHARNPGASRPRNPAKRERGRG